MTFRVIEGGGLHTLERAATPDQVRAMVIDRVAESIFITDGPLPEQLGWSMFISLAANRPWVATQVDRYRQQARAALSAMKSISSDIDEMTLFLLQDLDPEEVATSMCAMNSYIDEVLK